MRISRPTLYRYTKEGIIKAQKLPSGFYDYNEEDVYRLVNKDITLDQMDTVTDNVQPSEV